MRPNLELHRSASAAGFNYAHTDLISVCSIVVPRAIEDGDFSLAIEACVDPAWRLLNRVARGRVAMFAASPFWAPPNALQRRRGLWGTRELEWSGNCAGRSDSVMLERDGEARFVGIVELTEPQIGHALNFTRRYKSSAIITFSGELATIDSSSIYHSLFAERSTSIDLVKAINMVGESLTAYAQVCGDFDDREFSVDLFFENSLFDSVQAEMKALP
jgi:hypothetical protein